MLQGINLGKAPTAVGIDSSQSNATLATMTTPLATRPTIATTVATKSAAETTEAVKPKRVEKAMETECETNVVETCAAETQASENSVDINAVGVSTPRTAVQAQNENLAPSKDTGGGDETVGKIEEHSVMLEGQRSRNESGGEKMDT